MEVSEKSEKSIRKLETQFNYPKKVGFRAKEEKEEATLSITLSERVAGILKEGVTKEAIDVNCSPTKKVSQVDSRMLRELYLREKVEELVELLTAVEPAVLDKVLSGLYWPYAGGLLKPRDRQGPLPVGAGIPKHVRMFSRCVVEIAVETLDRDDIDVFCRMLGVEGGKLNRAISTIEPRSQADVKQYLTVSYRTQVNRDYRAKRTYSSS